MKQITRSRSATRVVAPDCPGLAVPRALGSERRDLPAKCGPPDGLTKPSRHIGSIDVTLLPTPDPI